MALVIQLVDRMCNDCFKLKHLFLLSLDLVDILVKNVDELGSEHHVRTHINEPPCLDLKKFSLITSLKQLILQKTFNKPCHETLKGIKIIQ